MNYVNEDNIKDDTKKNTINWNSIVTHINEVNHFKLMKIDSFKTFRRWIKDEYADLN